MSLILPAGIEYAQASHSTDNTHDLQITPETDANPTGEAHTLVATVDVAAAGCSATTEDVCEIDFEVETGEPVTFSATSTSSNTGTANDGNTPTSPDATCIINEDVPTPETSIGDDACSIIFTGATAGAVTVRGWVDDDQDNTTADADLTEGADAGDAPGEPAGGTAAPGDRTEIDDTDVVIKTYFTALPALARLDCTPETATNPATGDGSAETYTCNLWSDANDNGVQNSGESALAGFKIDGENCGGGATTDNDPDNADCTAAANTADYNDAGTTDAAGSATITVPASEAQNSQAGGTDICFWVDADANTTFAPLGDTDDGGDCDTDTQADDVPADGLDSQITDVVTKSWLGRGVPYYIVVTPGSAQNLKGESHTVTATVFDAFDDAVPGVFVDFDITGRNDGADPNANQQLTGAGGAVTFTYTDVNTGTPNGELDTITAYVDNNNDNAADLNADSAAITDDALKFWFTTEPTSANVLVDLDATCPDTFAGGGVDLAETNTVAEIQTLCASAYNAAGAVILGEEITLTTDLGFFVTSANGTFAEDDDANLGDTITVAAGADGDADVQLVSTAIGQSTITATADAATNSDAVETWTADEARNLACAPATSSNEPGTEQVITCNVSDRYSNPTNEFDEGGVECVNFLEQGPGRFEFGPGCYGVGADGVVEVVATSTPTETGDFDWTAELSEDVADSDSPTGDLDNPCDLPQGSLDADEVGGPDSGRTEGAPTGNCEQGGTITWETQPTPPACSDGVDNDGDGVVDSNDPGCHTDNDATNSASYDENDDDETDVAEDRDEARTISIRKHFQGKVSATSSECVDNELVKLFRKKKGKKHFKFVGSTNTNSNGNWSIFKKKGNKKSRWYAKVVKSSFTNETGGTTTCLKAKSPTIRKR